MVAHSGFRQLTPRTRPSRQHPRTTGSHSFSYMHSIPRSQALQFSVEETKLLSDRRVGFEPPTCLVVAEQDARKPASSEEPEQVRDFSFVAEASRSRSNRPQALTTNYGASYGRYSYQGIGHVRCIPPAQLANGR